MPLTLPIARYFDLCKADCTSVYVRLQDGIHQHSKAPYDARILYSDTASALRTAMTCFSRADLPFPTARRRTRDPRCPSEHLLADRKVETPSHCCSALGHWGRHEEPGYRRSTGGQHLGREMRAMERAIGTYCYDTLRGSPSPLGQLRLPCCTVRECPARARQLSAPRC